MVSKHAKFNLFTRFSVTNQTPLIYGYSSKHPQSGWQADSQKKLIIAQQSSQTVNCGGESVEQNKSKKNAVKENVKKRNLSFMTLVNSLLNLLNVRAKLLFFASLAFVFFLFQIYLKPVKLISNKSINNNTVILLILIGSVENPKINIFFNKVYIYFFIIFCLLLLLNYIYFYFQIDKWFSSYNLVFYFKKKLIIPFLSYYFFILASTTTVFLQFFSPILHSCQTSIKLLLVLFFISLLTLGFIIVLRIKIIQEQFSLKLEKMIEYENFGIDYNLMMSKKNKLINSLTSNKFTNNQKKHIQEKLNFIINYESIYNQMNKNETLFILTKKINASKKLKAKWLSFYMFLLNFFLVCLLFSYFHYFNVKFQVADKIVSSNYIFICLFTLLSYLFIQNYLILFIIKNNSNGDYLAIYTYLKKESKYTYFGFSENNKIAYIFINIITVIIILFYILLNYRILSMIFNQIYFKSRISMLEAIFNIPFKPIFQDLVLPINKLFYNYLNPFMGLMFIFIITLLGIFFLQIYFKILCYIYLDELSKPFLNQDFSMEPLLTNEVEFRIKQNFKNYTTEENFEIGRSYIFNIICFNNLKNFFKLNYEKHKILSFDFFKYNFYFIIIPTIAILFLFVFYVMIKNYINLYLDLTNFIQLGGDTFFLKGGTLLGKKLVVKGYSKRYTDIKPTNGKFMRLLKSKKTSEKQQTKISQTSLNDPRYQFLSQKSQQKQWASWTKNGYNYYSQQNQRLLQKTRELEQKCKQLQKQQNHTQKQQHELQKQLNKTQNNQNAQNSTGQKLKDGTIEIIVDTIKTIIGTGVGVYLGINGGGGV
jgi:hypothetical protein